jgi:hypothetical protein
MASNDDVNAEVLEKESSAVIYSAVCALRVSLGAAGRVFLLVSFW